MPNQYPSVTLKLNIEKPTDEDLINKEFTKTLSSILISILPKDKAIVDELILNIKKDLHCN